MSKPTFLLIDAHAIIHRAYHAYPTTLKTANGEHINAVYGFTAILLDVLKRFKPEYIICAFDAKGKTVRHKMYTEYKGTRKPIDPELKSQIPKVHDIVKAFNIPLFIQEGYEADDLLGTIVNDPKVDGNVDKIIVTGDQDIFQLIDEYTKVYISGSSFSAAKLYDADGVKKKFGFGPEYIVDYKALRGDPSDNIPGVAGIGDKGAKELIAQFGHLEEILKNVDKIETNRVKNKFIVNEKGPLGGQVAKPTPKEQALMSKELATIITNVPIKFKLEDGKLSDYNPKIVKKLFLELGFRSLMNKLPENTSSMSDGKVPQNNTNLESTNLQMALDFNTKFSKPKKKIKTNYKLVKTYEEIDSFMKVFSKQKIFAFDTEATGKDTIRGEILGISVSWKEGEAYYLDLSEINPEQIDPLRKVFENSKIKKIAHNMKYDAHLLRSKNSKGVELGIEMKNYFFDTKIAAYLLGGGQDTTGLKALAFRELAMQMSELKDLWVNVQGYKKKASYKPDEVKHFMTHVDIQKLSDYACADADATWRLYKLYERKLESNKRLKKLFYDVEMPNVEILLEMEREGIALDQKYLIKLGEKFDKDIEKLEKRMYDFVGHEFKISSPKQIGEVLFDELEFPGGKKTKTGAWQTNERILNNFIIAGSTTKENIEFVKNILKYRELAKLRSTYVDSLISEVNKETEKIHTSYNQTVAATGRLSSTGPNLQNIPVATDIGNKIREAFVADPGTKLVAFDISQQELRILAHMSGEKELIDAYKKDVDVHAMTASRMFDVPINEVTKKQRSQAKTLNYSLIYGITAFGLSDRMKISRYEAQDLIDTYFVIYPGIKKYFDKILEEAADDGKIETLLGRYRDASDLKNSNFARRSAAEREVINFPFQGTAADMMKVSMVECYKFINSDKNALEINAKMILQVHDEIIFRVDDKPSKINEFGKKIKEIMESSVKLVVPMKVDMHVGDNWGELK